MQSCPGNWFAIEHVVLCYARFAHTSSAGINCRQCSRAKKYILKWLTARGYSSSLDKNHIFKWFIAVTRSCLVKVRVLYISSSLDREHIFNWCTAGTRSCMVKMWV